MFLDALVFAVFCVVVYIVGAWIIFQLIMYIDSKLTYKQARFFWLGLVIIGILSWII